MAKQYILEEAEFNELMRKQDGLVFLENKLKELEKEVNSVRNLLELLSKDHGLMWSELAQKYGFSVNDILGVDYNNKTLIDKTKE